MASVEFVRGMVQTPVHRWLCDSCRRPVRYLNRMQREQWPNKEPVQCRGLLQFRRECKGHLKAAESVSTP